MNQSIEKIKKRLERELAKQKTKTLLPETWFLGYREAMFDIVWDLYPDEIKEFKGSFNKGGTKND